MRAKGFDWPETVDARVDLAIQAVVEEVRASVSLFRMLGMFSLRERGSSTSPVAFVLVYLEVNCELQLSTLWVFSESILNSNDLILTS